MTAKITDLRLTHFRNFDSLRLQPTHHMIVLTGGNGMGKTNILEAISLLSPGKGLKNAQLSDLNAQKPDSSVQAWAVHARLTDGTQQIDLGIGQDPTATKDKRLIKINGEVAKSQKQLASYAQFVWLTPSMDRIWIEGKTEKRQFLDRMIFSLDPAHADRVSSYEKAMRERFALLKTPAPDATWLGQIEQVMVTQGLAIIEARAHYLAQLKPHLNALPSFPLPDLTYQGDAETHLAQTHDKHNFYADQLRQNRSGDLQRGMTRFGPHRTDVVMRDAISGLPAHMVSTGEQKALLFSYVLAHCRLRLAQGLTPPILLLDEVVAHIDPERREVFCNEIIDLGLQAWLTGTESYFFDALKQKAQYLSVKNGILL